MRSASARAGKGSVMERAQRTIVNTEALPILEALWAHTRRRLGLEEKVELEVQRRVSSNGGVGEVKIWAMSQGRVGRNGRLPWPCMRNV